MSQTYIRLLRGLSQRTAPLDLEPGTSIEDAAALAQLISDGFADGVVIRGGDGSIAAVGNITITASGREYLKLLEEEAKSIPRFVKKHAGKVFYAILGAVLAALAAKVIRSN